MLIHTTAWSTIGTSTEIQWAGADGVRLLASGGSPSIIGISDPGFDGVEMVLHNLSGGPITLVHRSASVTEGSHQLILASQSDHVMEHGDMLWALRVAPQDDILDEDDYGWHVDNEGQASPARVYVIGSTSAPTYSSGTFAVIPQMEAEVETLGGCLSVAFSGTFEIQSDDAFEIALFLDDTEVDGTRRRVEYSSATGLLGLISGCIDGLPISLGAAITTAEAGEHTVDVRWSRIGGTARAVGTQRSLMVVEITH